MSSATLVEKAAVEVSCCELELEGMQLHAAADGHATADDASAGVRRVPVSVGGALTGFLRLRFLCGEPDLLWWDDILRKTVGSPCVLSDRPASWGLATHLQHLFGVSC